MNQTMSQGLVSIPLTDDALMERCLELAMMGSGRVLSNPLVGAIIFDKKNRKIISEGFHEKFGNPHAEINALSRTHFEKDANYVMYVNLEPCCIHGKTPPCTDAILKSPVEEIVIGTPDPNPAMNGTSIEILRKAGKKVITGIKRELCEFVNRRFFTYWLKRRPYVILKWASSINGVMGSTHQKIKITDLEDHLVHKWRATEMAILIGGKTLRIDNPLLTVRKWYGTDPIVCILTAHKPPSMPLNFVSEGRRIIIFTTSAEAKQSWEEMGFKEIVLLPQTKTIHNLLDYLWDCGVISLMVEGGPLLISNFLRENLWDEARWIVKHKYIQGDVKVPDFPMSPLIHAELEGATLLVFFNENPKCYSLSFL